MSSTSRGATRRRLLSGLAALAVAAAVLAVAPPASATSAVTATRVAGLDRYATSAAVSSAAFPGGAGTVVVASGLSFADGLSAAGLAGHLDAPVLLVAPGGPLAPAVRTELQRLGATSARIVGGVAAVGEVVADELEARGLAVTRIGGIDRYDTAAQVARRIPAASVGALDGRRTAFVATGERFPDALAASAPAFSGPHPILLTPSATLSEAARAALVALGIEQVVIMGGTGAVSTSVEQAINAIPGVDRTIRLAGNDRGATARALADRLVTDPPTGFGYGVDGVVVTSGDAFADALAAGPLAGGRSAPILFATPTSTAAEAYLATHRTTVAELSVIGGTAAVPDTVVSRLRDAATSPSNQTLAVVPQSPRSWDSTPYDAADPTTYVEYTVSGIPSTLSSVAIALADPANVTVGSGGTVTFAKAVGSPVRADLANARLGNIRIHRVNGSAPTGGPATSLASVPVVNRAVSFRLAVGNAAAAGEAVPVVYAPSGGNLPLNAAGEPTGAFGIGGVARVNPPEAPASSTPGTYTVFSVEPDAFVGTAGATAYRFHHRAGDSYRIGGTGGTTASDRSAFLAALSAGDSVTVTYNQRVGAAGTFVANSFNLVDDLAAPPTNVTGTVVDTDSNGSAETVRLAFTAPRTGLQTSEGALVRRYPVVDGVVGTTPTDVTATWAYQTGTAGRVDVKAPGFPPPGTYVFQIGLKGLVGTSHGPFSALSPAVTVSSTGLATVASAPIAVAIGKAESTTVGTLGTGDVITVTFNEPVQLTTGTRFIEIEDADGDRARLQSAPTANATFAVGGVDANVLTITVTGAPVVTAGAGTVQFAATTFVHSVSTTFRDRQSSAVAWDPSPANTLGAGGLPLGVSRVPSTTPVEPFTLTADTSGGSTGRITLNHVANAVVGQAGAAVPGAVVFVSEVAGTGGTAADAAAATRRQAVATSTGAFTIPLTTATEATTVKVRQEVQRTATQTLPSAASASIVAQPNLLATSALGGDDGEIGNGDTIVLRFSGAMTATDVTGLSVSVSNANPNVISVSKGASALVTVTTTGVRYNTGLTAMTFNTSSGAWSDGNTVLTITLAGQTGGIAATGVAAHTSSYVAGPYLVDAGGVAIDTTAVTGASSRF